MTRSPASRASTASPRSPSPSRSHPQATPSRSRELVRELLPELEESIGGDTKFTVVFDQAPFIEESIESLATEGLLGLAVRRARHPRVPAVDPLDARDRDLDPGVACSSRSSACGSAGYTLNIITLGALTIAIGRVVDDSIVVIENIKRHLGARREQARRHQDGGARGRGRGHRVDRHDRGRVPAARARRRHHRRAVPTVRADGRPSRSRHPSFVSLTIVPVLAYWFLGDPKTRTPRARAMRPGASGDQARARRTSSNPTRLQKVYLPVLRWTLRHPVAHHPGRAAGPRAPVPVGMFALKTNFIGDSGQNTLTVTQTLPLGTSLDARDEAAQEVEDVFVDIDGVETVQLSIGSAAAPCAPRSPAPVHARFSITTDDVRRPGGAPADRPRRGRGSRRRCGEVTLRGRWRRLRVERHRDRHHRRELRRSRRSLRDRARGGAATSTWWPRRRANLSDAQPYVAIEVDREKAAEPG